MVNVHKQQKHTSEQCCGTKAIKWLATGQQRGGSQSNEALQHRNEKGSRRLEANPGHCQGIVRNKLRERTMRSGNELPTNIKHHADLLLLRVVG